MRINKFISESGITSRRKAEELILEGRVTVNGTTVDDLSFQINPDSDKVELDGEKIFLKKHVYYLMNKPKGVVTTTSDEKNRKTVLDLIKTKEKIYPVGRLDYNTTGVLILTNDGDFANLLTHPGNRIPRVYQASLDSELNEEDKKKLLSGVYLEGRKSKFNTVHFYKHGNRKLIEISCVEGRNHFIKKMLEILGYNVLSLNRKSFAQIEADIPVGSYRKLLTSEVNGVKEKYAK